MGAASRVLAANVYVNDPSSGMPLLLEAGTAPPDWALKATYEQLVSQGINAAPKTVTLPLLDDHLFTTEAASTEGPGPDDDGEQAVTERPAKSASVDVWRSYAGHLGVDTDGLKKPEVIAAVNAHEAQASSDDGEGEQSPDAGDGAEDDSTVE